MSDYVGKHRDTTDRVACTCMPVIEFALNRARAAVTDSIEHHEPTCALVIERRDRLHLTVPAGDGTLPA